MDKEKIKKDIGWLIDHPDKSMGSTYHDGGSAYALAEVAIHELGLARKELKMLVESVVEVINRNFSEDYGFPKDFVSSRMNKDGDFILHIGNRDIQLASNGECIGSGTCVIENWKIEKLF